MIGHLFGQLRQQNAYTWAHSRVEQNRLQHAINGNTASQPSPRFTAADQEVMSLTLLRSIPGAVHNGPANVAPDGRCPTSCILAAFNVAEYAAVARSDRGYVLDPFIVKREEHECKAYLAKTQARLSSEGQRSDCGSLTATS